MTLSRSSPLTSNREHDWEHEYANEWRCSRCYARRWSRTEPDAGVFPCTGLKRGSLDRTGGLSPVSETNSGREHQRDEGLREYVRRLPCLVCGAPPRSQAAHVRNWGAGWGDWLPNGDGNLYPACEKHHRQEENEIGWGPERFEEEYGISLEAEAERIGEQFQDADIP